MPLGVALSGWSQKNARFFPIGVQAQWHFPPVKATKGAAGVVFFVFDKPAGAILVREAPKIAKNGPCPCP